MSRKVHTQKLSILSLQAHMVLLLPQLQLQLEHAVAVQLPGWEPDECKAASVAARAAKAKHGAAFQLAFQCRYNITLR